MKNNNSAFNENFASESENPINLNLNIDIDSKSFTKFSTEIQAMVLENVTLIKQMEIGEMGKKLGTKMPNMAVYSAFLLCCYLLGFATFIVFISWCCEKTVNLEIVKIIIPVFTMSLGYMFGKNDNHD